MGGQCGLDDAGDSARGPEVRGLAGHGHRHWCSHETGYGVAAQAADDTGCLPSGQRREMGAMLVLVLPTTAHGVEMRCMAAPGAGGECPKRAGARAANIVCAQYEHEYVVRV